jgi:hypothetical protein
MLRSGLAFKATGPSGIRADALNPAPPGQVFCLRTFVLAENLSRALFRAIDFAKSAWFKFFEL